MSDKYKREIEEILKKKGGLNPSSNYEEGFWRQLIGAFSDGLRKISVIRIIVASAVIVFLSFLFRIPILMWGGVILCLIGYGLFLVRPRNDRAKKYWRGQPIEGRKASWWNRMRGRTKEDR